MARTEAEKERHRRYKDSPHGRAKVNELKREWARRRAAREREQEELDRIVDAFLARPPAKPIPEHIGRELRWMAAMVGLSLPP